MNRRLLAAVLLFAVASPAFGWGRLGHRLVAELAQDELKSDARKQVDELLAGEPGATLASIAPWADEVRSKDPVLGKRSAPWHYVTVHADDCDYDAASDCKRGDCVVGAIEKQAAILADRGQPVEARRTALKFVVHFVGDVHQPLHAGNRPDKGGNTVQVRLPTATGGERGSNLHSTWDSGLIDLTGRDEATYLRHLRSLPLAVPMGRPALPPQAAQWAEASCAITLRPGLYPGSARLDADYARRWTPVIDEQLRRAGTHLAQVLNAALAR
ncbi:MAG TPA: S1/P1 nuclease [Lysobacter sp.]|nr:S1/P1 nuclease [Lysobacter sp.]